MTTIVEASLVAAAAGGVIVGAAAVQAVTPAPVALEMNSTLLVSAIVGGVVTVIGASTAGIVTVISAMAGVEDRREAKAAREKSEKAEEVAQKAREAAATIAEATALKTDEVVIITGKIHELADGRLHSVTSDLKVAMEKIDGLQKLVTAMAEARTATAVALAMTPPGTVPPEVQP